LRAVSASAYGNAVAHAPDIAYVTVAANANDLETASSENASSEESRDGSRRNVSPPHVESFRGSQRLDPLRPMSKPILLVDRIGPSMPGRLASKGLGLESQAFASH
jgi:hypothetical protein